METPLVSISCLVYNHEPFLRECFEGFMMQKTNFPFEVLVHDDASTDKSADIIREYTAKYPDIFKPIYQTENQYSKGVKVSVTYNFPRAKGKYIALCEGDDYWTDPLKLQKQVDILEVNERYGCVYTAYKTVDVIGNDCIFPPSINHMERSFTGDVFLALLYGNFPQTLTVAFRKDLLQEQFAPPCSFDYTLFLSMAMQSEFYYLNEITGAYRINPNGAVQTGSLKKYKIEEMLLYFLKEYLSRDVYSRPREEHKKISLFFLKKLCNVSSLVKNYSYFKDIVKSRPLLIFIIPFFLIENSLKNYIVGA